MNKRNTRKGFTLIELIVVIAILAILAAVAVPSFIGVTDRANTQVEVTTATTYATAINTYNYMNPETALKSVAEGDLTEAMLTALPDFANFKPVPSGKYVNTPASGETAAVTLLDDKILARITISTAGSATVTKVDKIS